MRKLIVQFILFILLTVIVINLYNRNTVLRFQKDILSEGIKHAGSGG